jgi:ABC-type multidrug transport system fused ATPase/permease subunit
MRKAWGETAAGAVLLVLSAAMELVQPWPFKWLVDCVFGTHPAPHWLARAFPALATRDAGAAIATVCVMILVLAVVHRLIGVLGHMSMIRAGWQLVLQLRCTAFERLHRLSLSYHDRTKVGESLYRVAYDAHAAQSLLTGALVPIATGTLMLIGVIIVMLRLDALLTLITLAIAPAFLLTIRFFGRKIDELSKRYHQSESGLVSTVQESLSSIRAVQAFTLELNTAQRFRTQAEESLSANLRLSRTQMLFSAAVAMGMTAGTVAVIWIGALRVVDGRLSLGDILVFLAYLGMLYQPMNAFSQSVSVAQAASAQLRRVFEVIDAVPEIKDRPDARTLPSVRGAVEFREVGFAYETGRTVLQDNNLKFEPGQVVAIVGRTGAGKTTMASLLLRFYDPTAGAVLLDGHDLRDLKVAWVRQQVSVVLQDPILFCNTIAENIAYGKPGASLEEIKEAARRAQADEFIRAQPKGYDTMLGERGVNLSGGQRQRLAIARAFLKNAPVLVLDEPTSALDTHTEEALLACMKELMRGRTTFIIAHRLSTVRFANLIVVIEDSRIVERGSHHELLNRDSLYRRMYRSQWGDVSDRYATLVETSTA